MTSAFYVRYQTAGASFDIAGKRRANAILRRSSAHAHNVAWRGRRAADWTLHNARWAATNTYRRGVVVNHNHQDYAKQQFNLAGVKYRNARRAQYELNVSRARAHAEAQASRRSKWLLRELETCHL